MPSKFKPNKNVLRLVINKLSSALDDAAEVYEREAENLTPVESGKLKRSWKIEKIEKLERRIKNTADYAGITEFGGLKRAPNPFARPALKSAKKRIMNQFKGIL